MRYLDVSSSLISLLRILFEFQHKYNNKAPTPSLAPPAESQ